MFGRRRRPLLRAAMVGGVAYHAGKRRQDTIQQDGRERDPPKPLGLGVVGDPPVRPLQLVVLRCSHRALLSSNLSSHEPSVRRPAYLRRQAKKAREFIAPMG